MLGDIKLHKKVLTQVNLLLFPIDIGLKSNHRAEIKVTIGQLVLQERRAVLWPCLRVYTFVMYRCAYKLLDTFLFMIILPERDTRMSELHSSLLVQFLCTKILCTVYCQNVLPQ